MVEKQITRSPIDHSIYVERTLATAQDIDKTLKKAQQAQKKWRHSPIEERAMICHGMIDHLLSRTDEIAEQLSWMMGRPIRYGKGEVQGMAERARFMIDAAASALTPIVLPEPLPQTPADTQADKSGLQRYIKREPLGLVFVIAPWNYPYLTAINTIIPAIMAGNSVLLKHSAQTPLCAEQFFWAFQQTELPAGVFQYLHLSHVHTEEIIRKGAINHVAFTGSVEGGKMVERASAGRFINIGLELGGKDAAYIRADANINMAVETCIDGAFFNSGQSCCGIERLYVHADVYESAVEQAVALVKQYQLGRPDEMNTTLGPVVKASAADYIRSQVKDALSKGAKAHITPADFPLDNSSGAYLAPQVLTQVDHTMSVMKEESFGPILGIMKVDDDQQAIELINDSDFGLTAAVFTQDTAQGIAIGEKLDVGTFFINRCDYLDPALAWTGVKHSGRGCTLSTIGYETLTRPKSFHLKIDTEQ